MKALTLIAIIVVGIAVFTVGIKTELTGNVIQNFGSLFTSSAVQIDETIEDVDNEIVEAEQMSVQQFLLARQKYRKIMVPFEFQLGSTTLTKNLPCRMIMLDEQEQVFSLITRLQTLAKRLDKPPKTEKGLTNLMNKVEKIFDEIYQFAVDLCLDPEITMKFFKENNIGLDVPLKIIGSAGQSFNELAVNIPKFRG